VYNTQVGEDCQNRFTIFDRLPSGLFAITFDPAGMVRWMERTEKLCR
jgi:hypothetical protein